MDDKDRTIKIQQNQIDKLESDVVKLVAGTEPVLAHNVDTTNIATQTERVRLTSPAVITESKLTSFSLILSYSYGRYQ